MFLAIRKLGGDTRGLCTTCSLSRLAFPPHNSSLHPSSFAGALVLRGPALFKPVFVVTRM